MNINNTYKLLMPFIIAMKEIHFTKNYKVKIKKIAKLST